MSKSFVKFSKELQPAFYTTLRERVNRYLQEKQLSRFGNERMIGKTLFMLALYFVPYGLIIGGAFTSPWLHLLAWIIMGFGMSGIGLSIMHDANHGTYSSNRTVNRMLSYIMEMVGGSSTNWRIQHNQLHHSFTNVDGLDEDIDAPGHLRFSPNQERSPIHRYQHIYAWFMYSLMTLYWATAKDFMQLKRYRDDGMVKAEAYPKLLAQMIAWKVFYYIYALIIPIILAPVAWWVTLTGFLLMHLIGGLVLSCIFQTAHVMPTSEYPVPDATGSLENDWAVHQLLTTANYSPRARFFSWFVGGLNYQVEHHLFPNISHVHYRKISQIVKDTAEQFGLPYHSQPNFWVALKEHARMLKHLGRHDGMPSPTA